jgi:hypothetical protein
MPGPEVFTVRKFLALFVAPVLALTGRRFGKVHRWNNTLTYRLLDTVHANILASKLRPTQDEREFLALINKAQG